VTPEELEILKAISCQDVETFLPGVRAPLHRLQESVGRSRQAKISGGGRQVPGPWARGAP
jgi:hypothetical protein